MDITRKVLDHGYVRLRNVAGPVRRADEDFDADDCDPANSARFSFDSADKVDRPREADLKLAKYLLQHKHTTPFEMITVWLEMKMPIFIARQFVRHRTVSINEISGRYIKFPDEFYIPDPNTVGTKAPTNKQGRLPDGINPYAQEFCDSLRKSCTDAYTAYSKDLENGIPNEIARSRLPVTLYTKWLWKQDLHNMMHFMAVRIDNHAQWEARQYAQAMYELLQECLPYSMELFDKYRRLPGNEPQVTPATQAGPISTAEVQKTV
jgi:thymidylate synthase (FAD)